MGDRWEACSRAGARVREVPVCISAAWLCASALLACLRVRVSVCARSARVCLWTRRSVYLVYPSPSLPPSLSCITFPTPFSPPWHTRAHARAAAHTRHAHARTHTHTRAHTHIHAHAHAHARTRARARAHTHTHTHTQTHTHTHTHLRAGHPARLNDEPKHVDVVPPLRRVRMPRGKYAVT